MQKYNNGVPNRDTPYIFWGFLTPQFFSFALGKSLTLPNTINRSAVELSKVGPSVKNPASKY